MISVYDIDNYAFEKNGDVILKPTSCVIKNAAAGNYDLTMEHPIDPDGKWTHLVPEAIIKAPIPEELIENAFAGMEADVYITTTSAALREGPSEPTRITYGGWSSGATYSVGAKVTYNSQNYQCTQFDESSGYIMVPPSNSPWWRKIANYTSGSPVLIQMKSGMELYYVSGPSSSGWYKMSTMYGLEGYIKSSQVEYEKHLTPSETHDRLITEQLFRIKKVTVDTKNMKASVSAEHVSYDLNGVLIDYVKVVRKPAAQAISWIENAFMINYQGTIASNIISSSDRLYSAEISGRNGTYARLDPDKGVVAQFQAAYRRDNWDLFVMEKNNTDRGFRLRYSNNLIGVNWKIGSDQLVTRVVPVAKDQDGSELLLNDTIAPWVDSEYISNYPVIRMERLKVAGQVGKDDGTETATNWTKETLRAEMLKQAQSRFNVDKCDQYKHELTVDFTRLGDTEEYKQFHELQVLRLYDSVIIQDPRIDLSVSAEVIEIEFDAVNERVTAMKLSNIEGYNVKNVAGFNVLNNSINGNKLTDDAGDEIVDEAVDEAADYTDKKATDTLNQSKNYTSSYVGDKHGYSSFEEYIKAYCDQNYAPKS